MKLPQYVKDELATVNFGDKICHRIVKLNPKTSKIFVTWIDELYRNGPDSFGELMGTVELINPLTDETIQTWNVVIGNGKTYTL